MTAPLAGWYPDPSGAADFRWWDGTSWTDAISDSAEVAAPGDARPVGGPADSTDPTTPAAEVTGAAVRPVERGSSPTARGSRMVALLIAISLVISGGVVGLIGWRGYQSSRSADGSAGSPASADPTARPSERGKRRASTDPRSGQLDEVTRKASIGQATIQLPPDPYELVSDPVTVPGVFDAMFVANAPVHRDYNGSDSWAATVGIGHIPADAWSDDDLPGFGRKALKGISEQFFGYTPTSVKKLSYRPTTVGDSGCAELTADVHYAVKGLASKFDRVRIVGCPDGADGSMVAALSSVPDDAPHRVSTVAKRSMSTFALR